MHFWEIFKSFVGFLAVSHQQGHSWPSPQEVIIGLRVSERDSVYCCPDENAQDKNVGCAVSLPHFRSNVEVWATSWGQPLFSHIHIFVVLIALSAWRLEREGESKWGVATAKPTLQSLLSPKSASHPLQQHGMQVENIMLSEISRWWMTNAIWSHL